MADDSSIEWTDATWNPVRGCTKVSAGCKFCYAETFAERFRGVPGHPYEQGFDLRLVPEALDKPLRWKKPRRIFVNSMSDLFHEGVPDDYIRRVFDVMVQASWHTFQVLTKRAERLAALAPSLPWPDNIWMGVSVENQQAADRRIPHLLRVPALRFLSLEPLLGPVNLRDVAWIHGGGQTIIDALAGDYPNARRLFPGIPRPPRLDWIIVGGESGTRSRLCEVAWIRSLVAQAQATQVPVFVKQLGYRAADAADGIAGAGLVVADEALPMVSTRLRNRKGNRPDEWPADLRVRQWPARAA